MKLIDLVEKIQRGETEQFLLDNSVDIEYDLIDIYAEGQSNIEAEIWFFNAEEITNEILISVEGIEYENICPLNMLEDLVNDFMADDSEINSFEITTKILSYLEKDA